MQWEKAGDEEEAEEGEGTGGGVGGSFLRSVPASHPPPQLSSSALHVPSLNVPH